MLFGMQIIVLQLIVLQVIVLQIHHDLCGLFGGRNLLLGIVCGMCNCLWIKIGYVLETVPFADP